MKAFHEYWTFSAIRGAMTVLACVAILVLPQVTSSMLSIPVLITLAILCLATYSVFDAGVMILLAKLLPRCATHSYVLYGQALIAVVSGSLLYLVAYEQIDLRWLMGLAASQAAIAAIFEFIVARDTHRQYQCLSCYATSMVLAAAAIGLPFATGLNANQLSLALAAYVGLYGTTQFLVGARMLFTEYREQHPAPQTSDAWRAAMSQPAPTLQPVLASRVLAQATGHDCTLCPADALCHDASLLGQVTRVANDRQPAIVRSMRIASLIGVMK